MRVTNNMLVRNMMINLNRNLGRMDKVQNQMATGKKVRVPSDDPIVASRSLKFRTDVSEIEQFKKNTDDALSWTEMTEKALANLGDVIHRTTELTVQAANGVLTDEDKLKIKAEITQLKHSIVDIGNTSYAGRYIFAGYKTNAPPFTVETHPELGDMLTYQGKFLHMGSPISADVPEGAYQAFYQENLERLYGQPELIMGKYESISLEEDQAFILHLDDTEYPLVLLEGNDKSIGNVLSEIEGQPPFSDIPPLVKVTEDQGKIKFTVLNTEINRVKLTSDALNISALGFAEGSQSVRNERQEMIYEIGVGNRIKINLEAQDFMGEGMHGLFVTFQKLEMVLDSKASYRTTDDNNEQLHTLKIGSILSDLDSNMNQLLKARADVGGRMNYIELVQNRLTDDRINFTALMSKNEDVDMAEVIMMLKNEENVYRASLSAGARIIQPTLMDFLR